MIFLEKEILLPHVQHTFDRLMMVYEQNYLRLSKLIPQLAEIQEGTVSCVPGCLDLHLQVIERHKYTTLLRLSYYFPALLEAQVAWQPNVLIKIYHDAKVAEARCGMVLQDVDGDSQMWQRWYWNQFLYKWLGYCIRQGHCLLPYEHYRKTRTLHFFAADMPESSA